MKHVVTGGCGFIGSHLVDYLVDLGHEVAVLDDLSSSEGRGLSTRGLLWLKARSQIWNWSPLPPRAQTACSIRLRGHGCHALIDDPVGTHEVNVNGTLNVLQAARENGLCRVVYSSSSSVYGDQETHLMREDMTPNPMSPYALQKLIGEQYGVCLRDCSECRSCRYGTSTCMARARRLGGLCAGDTSLPEPEGRRQTTDHLR